MKITSFEVVINRRYGGFHLDQEMADWLAENKGWKIVDYFSKDFNPNDKFDLQKLDSYYCPKKDDVTFRSNKDLIECVRVLQEKNKDASFSDKWHGEKKVFDLKIEEVTIEVDIEDYNDGYERINIHSAWIN